MKGGTWRRTDIFLCLSDALVRERVTFLFEPRQAHDALGHEIKELARVRPELLPSGDIIAKSRSAD
jgi:hypothetical protein